MPSVAASSKVLVTGGTGFLGIWVIKLLLEQGYSVRVAVRSPSKSEFVINRFKTYAEKLEFVTVEDIVAPGAFDEAVKGVDGVIHCAAPLSPADPLSDPAENIDPAVEGTLGILRSAHNATGIKRVVLTSSVVAARDLSSDAHVITEDDWNEVSPKIVEEKGRQAPGFVKYSAAKALAELAAWKWVKETNPSFDVATVLPAFIFGEILSETTANIKGSNALLFGSLKKGALAARQPDQYFGEILMVDVRDAAEHHILALTKEEAGGKRFLSTAATISYQEIFDILNANPVEGITVPKGYPEKQKDFKPKVVVSREKIEAIGGTFHSVEDTIRNTLIHGLEIGWTQ